MSIYEKTNVARALLYWAKNNNGNECYYLEDRMYAVADGDTVVILTADSYDEAKRKAKARHTQERPQQIVVIEPEIIRKAADALVEAIGQIDWNLLVNSYIEMQKTELKELRGGKDGKS